jgi:hypothetical protein
VPSTAVTPRPRTTRATRPSPTGHAQPSWPAPHNRIRTAVWKPHACEPTVRSPCQERLVMLPAAGCSTRRSKVPTTASRPEPSSPSSSPDPYSSGSSWAPSDSAAAPHNSPRSPEPGSAAGPPPSAPSDSKPSAWPKTDPPRTHPHHRRQPARRAPRRRRVSPNSPGPDIASVDTTAVPHLPPLRAPLLPGHEDVLSVSALFTAGTWWARCSQGIRSGIGRSRSHSMSTWVPRVGAESAAAISRPGPERAPGARVGQGPDRSTADDPAPVVGVARSLVGPCPLRRRREKDLPNGRWVGPR